MRYKHLVPAILFFLSFSPSFIQAGTINVVIGQSHIATTTTPSEIRALIRAYTGQGSVLVSIAYCESSYRQFDATGDVLRGYVNPHDIGLFQISEIYWLDISNQLGYNIYSLVGNIKMAKYIYERKGTQPWSASRDCWEV